MQVEKHAKGTKLSNTTLAVLRYMAAGELVYLPTHLLRDVRYSQSILRYQKCISGAA